MTRPLIALIEGNMKFQVNGETYTADQNGSHYNSDEECWIVYDTEGNSWFEEDIEKVIED